MAAAALTIDGLSVDFEGFKAVNEVTMVVDEASCAYCSAPMAPEKPR